MEFVVAEDAVWLSAFGVLPQVEEGSGDDQVREVRVHVSVTEELYVTWDTDRAERPSPDSVCLAVQNLWLAATAEGLGVGWVSFYREEFLRELVGLPGDLRPVAWLCVGPVRDLPTVPDLERHGWRERLPLNAALRTVEAAMWWPR